MAHAHDVARYLIRLAARGQDPLTHLRLQKLLYFAQAYSLGWCGGPLFRERIEAWKDGPVVPDVYQAYKQCGWGAIFPVDEDDEDDHLTDLERACVDTVWGAMSTYSATRLKDMTHQQAPWIKARAGCRPEERSNAEITRDSMRDFFARYADGKPERKGPQFHAVRTDEAGRIFYLETGQLLRMDGLGPAQVLLGMAEYRSGLGRPLDEVLAEIEQGLHG